MSYRVTQINDLEQFEELSTTFLLVDDEGIMPDVRVDKLFRIDDYTSLAIDSHRNYLVFSMRING